jgi:hypothetical protein
MTTTHFLRFKRVLRALRDTRDEA